MPKSRIAAQLHKNRETIHLWITGIEECGLLAFLTRYHQAKKGPRRARQVNPQVKRWIWELREREAQRCGQKIAYFLVQEHGVRLSVPKIYGILREKYVIRSKWKSMDFGGLFAFTAVDIYTREAAILLAPALTAANGCAFLDQAMQRRFGGHVALIQTDGGSEFKEAFAQRVTAYCDRRRVARP